ncbi:hypothetical protein LX77_00370 [Gelidibacter algens]|uniref:Uncharacterized protein n=1 Tax=Gelidibacter algens TaxID=49280 RepID=A0A327SFI7_9FLAO|nr:hypothetical protein LX77_00370 [Gelidibacter algens]
MNVNLKKISFFVFLKRHINTIYESMYFFACYFMMVPTGNQKQALTPIQQQGCSQL